MDDQFAQEAMLRLPPAQATLQIWRWIATDDLLAEGFDEHRGRSYERVIYFATVVQVMADALVRHQGTARRWFEQAIADGSLEASVQAAYGKLRRVPVDLSVSFMNQATSWLKAIWPEPSDRDHTSSDDLSVCLLRAAVQHLAGATGVYRSSAAAPGE